MSDRDDEKTSPGPWRWESGDDGRDRLVTADGFVVLDGYVFPHETGRYDLVIAAAPEMLVLLRVLSQNHRTSDETAERQLGCSWCDIETDHRPAHRPACRLGALLARIDGGS